MRLTRRQLITAVARASGYGAAFATMHALGLVAAPVARSEPFELSPGIGKSTKVVILGAGIAGLVAAYEMRRAGFDCTVLEARDRPGGRNWTIRRGTKVEFTDGAIQSCDFGDGLYFNAGPARLPAIYRTMIGYCRELGVPLEVEVNTTRSALLQNDRVFDGKPVQLREAINDTRGHVSELLAKSIQQGALDQEVGPDDKERMLVFLREYGNLDLGLNYRGSERSGALQLPGAADVMEKLRDPLPMHALLDADFWSGMLFEEELDQQATMFQPVGGMDRIPYAFAKNLGDIVKFNSPVKEIRKTPNGVRIAYSDSQGAPQSVEAAYCICCLPLVILRKIPNDLSPRVASAIQNLAYEAAYKVAWESPRFWEQENDIYGGISWLSNGPINLMWYPSANPCSERGVVIAGYAFQDPNSSIQAAFARSRAGVEKLHPGRSGELTSPIYVSWAKIPHNLGAWVSIADLSTTYYSSVYPELIVPDDRIYFAGDHCSRLVGWQEGAALSAQNAIDMIVDHMKHTSA